MLKKRHVYKNELMLHSERRYIHCKQEQRYDAIDS